MLTDTDDKKWVAIKTASGQKGWFSLNNWQINGHEASEYFEALCMAD